MARVGFYELDNGMDLIVHRDVDQNEFHFLFGAKMGSEKEGACRIEGTHLLEHLFFRSTNLESTMGALREWGRRRIRSQGETIDGHVCGFFYGPTKQMRYIIETSYGALMNDTHDLSDLEKEKRILSIERRAMKDDVDSRIDEVMLSHIYPGTRYSITFDELVGKIPQLTQTKVLNLKRQLFRPSNMTLVAIGNKDADSVFAVANESFGKMPNGRKLSPYRPTLPVPTSFRIDADDRGIGACRVRHVFRAGPDIGPDAKKRMAELYLLHSALGAGNAYDTSFLYQNLRLRTGRSYGPETTVVEGPPEQLLQIDYECGERDVDPNIYNIAQIMNGLANDCLSQEHIKTYANYAVSEFDKETTDDEEELAVWYLSNSANGVMMSTKEFKQLIRSVTPKRLRALAQELTPNMGTIVFHPVSGPITTIRQPALGNNSSLEGVVGAPGSSTSSSPDSTILKET